MAVLPAALAAIVAGIAPAAAAVPGVIASGAIATRTTPAGPELVIKLAQPAPAAAFDYGGHVWIVVATAERLARAPVPATARAFAELEVTRLTGAVALRLRRPSGKRLAVARTGGTWRFTFRPADAVATASPLRTVLHRSTLEATVVAVQGGRLATVHRLVDPVVGSTLIVVTTLDPAAAVDAAYQVPPFRLLPTRLGVAIEVRADGVTVESDATETRIRYRRREDAKVRR